MSNADSASLRRQRSHFQVGFYDIERTVGRGNFAVVKLARHRITKSHVAIKIIDKSRLDQINLDKVHREVQIMKQLRHPNIVKLYQVMETATRIYIVTEFAENGEIFEYIEKRGRLSEDEARVKFRDMVRAVKFCHDRRVVHRDLKAENLLLDSNLNVKIADFGFANFYDPDGQLNTWCGSPPYAAPEVFEGRKYTGPEVDMWSLGVVLYVLVCGALPFDGHDLPTLRDRVLGAKFRVPFFMSQECEDLLRHLLCRNASRRYTAAQALAHPWLAGGPAVPSPRDDDIGIIKQQVLTIMSKEMQLDTENMAKTVEAVEQQLFNNHSAIYHLLADTLRSAGRLQMLRRTSSVIDQTVTSPDPITVRPELAVQRSLDCSRRPRINLLRHNKLFSQTLVERPTFDFGDSFKASSSGLGSSTDLSELASSFDSDATASLHHLVTSTSSHHYIQSTPLGGSATTSCPTTVVPLMSSAFYGDLSLLAAGEATTTAFPGGQLNRQQSLKQSSFDTAEEPPATRPRLTQRPPLLKRSSLPCEMAESLRDPPMFAGYGDASWQRQLVCKSRQKHYSLCQPPYHLPPPVEVPSQASSPRSPTQTPTSFSFSRPPPTDSFGQLSISDLHDAAALQPPQINK